MTTQEKLLEAAEAALHGNAFARLYASGLRKVRTEMLMFDFCSWSNKERCLYLCFLAAAWDDL